jgi:hypothetical protein
LIPVFLYNRKKKTLVIMFPAILPIFISRALIQFAPEQLLNPDVYEKAIYEYKKVPLEAICELKRIFSEKSVEVVND